MKYFKVPEAEFVRVRFLDLNDPNFKLESHVINSKARHYLNVIDIEDNELKVLDLPSSSFRQILEVYRVQMEQDRLMRSQREAVKRFKQSRMKYATR